jgi:hypothetical protein
MIGGKERGVLNESVHVVISDCQFPIADFQKPGSVG